MEIREMPVEEIRNSFNTGDTQKDIEMINGYLAGTVVPQKPQEEQTQVEPEIEPEIEETEIPFVETDEYKEEVERQKRYSEYLEQRRVEEYEDSLRKQQQLKEDFENEKKAREELEKRLQQLNEANERPPSPQSDLSEDEDDEYASEYAKRTRRELEQLKATVGATSPLVKELTDKIAYLDREQAEKERLRNEQLRKETEEKKFKTIRDFQQKIPELTTQKDIREIEPEYTSFRKKIADLTKVKSVYELEKKIEDYRRGGETKAIADKHGISFPADCDKYLAILELVEMKRGVKYDPVLGKEIPILDDEGNPVRYRSLEEAYRVMNFDREIEKQKRGVYKEVSKKLSNIQDSAVSLPDEKVEKLTSGFTLEQEREIMNMNPKEWERDPEKRAMAEMVFRKRGLELPRFRGR